MVAIAETASDAARMLLKDRRDRDALFGDDRATFGEPGWDMMLALFVADGRRMHLSEVIDAAATRSAVAERYVEWLIARDLACRDGDDFSLSARGTKLMAAFLDRYRAA